MLSVLEFFLLFYWTQSNEFEGCRLEIVGFLFLLVCFVGNQSKINFFLARIEVGAD